MASRDCQNRWCLKYQGFLLLWSLQSAWQKNQLNSSQWWWKGPGWNHADQGFPQLLPTTVGPDSLYDLYANTYCNIISHQKGLSLVSLVYPELSLSSGIHKSTHSLIHSVTSFSKMSYLCIGILQAGDCVLFEVHFEPWSSWRAISSLFTFSRTLGLFLGFYRKGWAFCNPLG